MIKSLNLVFFFMLAASAVAQDPSPEYANELAEAGKLKKAIEVMDKVIAENPLQARYYKIKTYYQIQLKDYEGAVETLSKGINEMPDSVGLYSGRGVLLEAFRLYEEAIRDFTKAYEKADDHVTKAYMLSNRGGTKMRIRDFEGAYSDLMKAVELDSNNITALNNLAAACDELNKPDETLKYLEKVLQIDSAYTPAYVNIGFKYQGLGQHEKAISCFNKALELDPQEALAYSNRSYSKLKTKDLDGAMEDIDQSIKLMPVNSYAYKIRALVFLEKGKSGKACEDLDKALELGYTAQYGGEVEELIKAHCKK